MYKATPLTLFPHQVDGTKWMLKREKSSRFPGGLLLDDCGLGKTPQVIHVMSENPKPLTLIVAPVNIIKQWKDQLHRWVPHFKVIMCHGNTNINPIQFSNTEQLIDHLYLLADTAEEAQQPKRRRQKSRKKSIRKADIINSTNSITLNAMNFLLNNVRHKSIGRNVTRQSNPALNGFPPPQTTYDHLYEKGRRRPLVVITSYGKLVNRFFESVRAECKRIGILQPQHRNDVGATIFNKLQWSRIVLDESHAIRNFSTTRTRYVMSLNGDIKWCLTATPVHNGIHDYYCLLRFVGLQKWDIGFILGSHPALQK